MINQPNSTLQKIAEQKKLEQEKKREQEEKYQHCLNVVASTEEGLFVLRAMLNACGSNQIDASFNPHEVLYNNGRRSVYLQFVQAHLNQENKRRII